MKTLFRILGTAAAVAVTGAAIVALDKILNQKDPLHVEEVEFPEDAEQNAEEAAKTAEAYAEAETKASDAANEKAAEEAAPEAPAEEAAAAAQPAEEASAPAAPAEGGEKPVFDPEAPNQNLWKQAPPLLPKTRAENSNPTKIAESQWTLATGKNRAAKDNL